MTARFARLASPTGEIMWVRLDSDRGSRLEAPPWLAETTGTPLDGAFDELGHWTLPGSVRLAPVQPSKILCVGRNYLDHAKELGNEVPPEPMLFFKPPSSIIGPSSTITLPPRSISERVDHEAELAVVIGKRLSRASRDECEAAIFGLTIACDVTARDLQKKDGQWWRAKGMDTFCPVGPVLVAGLSSSDLTIECRVNGQLRQRGSTADMIFSIGRVLEHISAVMTLEPGDLVLTGTPPGVGPLTSGDRIAIEISGIGLLEETVA
ncbi:MAG: fumarylacetoacetate hydrolase family protein [Polyangiaceae bacterium]